jgi:ubiquinone/menaquinone biosynthesis C-methylase UbiE
VDVQFQVQDATKLEFGIAEFDTVFFSFNGLMTIPNHNNRVKAVQEVNRVLKKGGLFIFTTHDREQEEQFVEFWKTEKTKWEKGLQNQTLYEFGDIITSSKNETQDIYLHVPNKKEVTSLLEIEGFVVEETFYRNEKFQENENVLKQSGECRFWITRKI